MTICKNCNTAYDAEYKFCPTCGKPSDTVSCPSCYATVPAGSVYCPKCASPISHTEKCGHCGGMNAKNSKFCSVCGKTLKAPADVTADIARIKAVIPMLRNALEVREPQPQPVAPVVPLTKKELRAKRKIEKIAAKNGLTILEPEDEPVECACDSDIEMDLLSALPEPECNCGAEACICTPDPVVELLKEQNKNLENVINKLVDKVEAKKAEEPAQQAAPAQPAFPGYPFPMPYPMPYYQPAAPAQPIVIQQPAAAPAQPIVVQQPAAPAQSVVLQPTTCPVAQQQAAPVQPVETEQTFIITAESGTTAQEEAVEAKEKPAKKRRFVPFLTLLLSVGFLVLMSIMPMVIAPATFSTHVSGPHNGLDIARALFCIGGKGMLGLAGNTELANAVIATASTPGNLWAVVGNYVIFLLMFISITFMAFDVVMGIVRLIRGKFRSRRGFAVRLSLFCYLMVVLSVAVVSSLTSGDFMESLTAVFTSFSKNSVDISVMVLGLGGVAGLLVLVIRLVMNIFVRKSE